MSKTNAIIQESTRIAKAVTVISDYCVRWFGLWLFFDVLLSACTLFRPRMVGSIGIAESHFLIALIVATFQASVLTLFVSALWSVRNRGCRIVARILASVIAISVIAVCVVEAWLRFIIFSKWSDRIIAMIMGANTSERSEFFSTYLSGYGLAVAIAAIMFTYIIYDISFRFARFVSPVLKRLFARYGTLILVGILIVNIFSAVENVLHLNHRLLSKFPTQSPVIQFIKSAATYSENISAIRALEEIIPQATGRLRDDKNTPTKIVWVIGESDNRSHSPLYGYDKNTMPHLKREFEDGNILVYDAMSYVPSTFLMIEILYSLHVRTEKNTKFQDYPISTMVLRNAGYKVNLHDNQSTMAKGDNTAEIGASFFLNTPRLSEASFDYRNTHLEYLDGKFLDCEEEVFLRDTVTRSMDIFHFYGQHSDISKRYPKEQRYFRPSDYDDLIVGGAPLKHKFKELMAHYDNATRYLDSNINRIIEKIKDTDAILIYQSDHGEEICDWRQFYGRTQSFADASGTAEALLHVPFYVYTTPKFRERHPEQYERLKRATTRKLSLLYFSHFLLDVANVDSRWFRPELSPLSDRWSNPGPSQR